MTPDSVQQLRCNTVFEVSAASHQVRSPPVWQLPKERRPIPEMQSETEHDDSGLCCHV